MVDIAQLGLAVDSRQVKTAATDLDRLQGSANAAAAAADKLTSASGKSGVAAKAITGAAAPAVAATNALAKASNDAAHAHQGMSTQAMAAQHSIRSLAEALASGQPLTQALGQQLNHLSYAASGPGGITAAFKQAGGALVGLMSPATLVIAGLAGIAAAAAFAVVSIAKTEKGFDDASRAIGATLTQLHGLESAAAFKGIGTDEFLKGMEKFGASVYDAQHNMGALADVFRTNNASAKDFTGYLEKAADLIKNASSDQQRLQLLQQMGLPATMDWVRFLSQGKEGLRAAINEATKFGDTADTALIAKARKFDEEWAKAAKNLGTGLKSAIVESVSWIDTLGGKVNALLMKAGVNVGKNSLTDAFNGGSTASNKLTSGSDVSDFYKGLGAGAPGNSNPRLRVTADPNVLKDQIAKEQQRLALLGPLATAEDVVKAKELEINAARLNGVPISKDQAAAVLLVTRAQAEQARVSEQAAIGIFRTSDATKAMNDNLQALVAKKLLDPNNPKEYAAALNSVTKQMEEIADQAKVAGAALPQFQQAMNDATNARKQLDGLMVEGMSINRSFLTTFGQQLRNGVSGFQALKTAASDALGHIADKLMSMAADQLFANAFGGSVGSIASLFGLGGSGGAMSFAGDFGAGTGGMAFPKFASGTNSAPGGMAMVGERGPELVNLPRGAQVFNASQTQGMLNGGGVTVHTGDTNIIVQGNADEKMLAIMRRELAQRDAELPTRAIAAVQSAKKRNVKGL